MKQPPEKAPLNWDVFVTPGIPIVTPDRPAEIQQTYFQAMAATLIYGVRDAVLVDTFMTAKQANALADWVAAKGKNLTIIYITHGHGDHWFGIATLLERFPTARALATPNVVRVMRQHASPERLKFWKAAFPNQIPDRLVIAEELKGNAFELGRARVSRCGTWPYRYRLHNLPECSFYRTRSCRRRCLQRCPPLPR